MARVSGARATPGSSVDPVEPVTGRRPGAAEVVPRGHPRSRVFVTGPTDHRGRAADGVRAASAIVGVLLLGVVARPPSGLESAAVGLLAAVPPLLDDLWLLLAVGPAIGAVVLLAAAVAGRRPAVLGSLAVAGGLGAIGVVLGSRFDPGGAPWWRLLAFDPARPSSWGPPADLVVPAAVLLALRPHLVQPLRRVATVVVLLGAAAAAALGVVGPTGAVAAVLLALAAGRAATALLGSPAGRPDVARVAEDLDAVGMRATGLTPRGFTAAGAARFDALDGAGRPVVIDVLGRDDRDARLAAGVLRRVWYRSAGDPIVAGRFRQLRHRALQTMLAAEAGASGERILRVARAADGDALLVARIDASRFGRVDGGPAAAARLWATVERLHGAGLAHGRVDADHLTDDGVVVGLVGFDVSASAPAPERLRIDEAQALVTTALVLGAGPAVAAARTAIGPARLGELVSFVQPAVLTAAQRRDLGSAAVDLAALRGEAAAAADVAEPALVPVRRVKVLSVAQLLLVPVALAGLWSMVGEFDLDGLADQVAAASWTLIAVAAVVAQLCRVAQTFSTLGASPVAMPLGPLYALQLAVGYVNVVIPGGAARVAINVRFFQRHGLPSGSALAVGALDGISGLVLQIAVVPVLLVLGTTSLDLDLDLTPRDDLGLLLLIGAGLLVAVVAGLLAVGRLRRAVLGWAAQAVRDAASALRGLRDPRRLVLLAGGNLASDLAVACSLAATVRAFGHPVPLGELWLITMTVAVLAWVIPVPGGIGVSETGLLIGLVGAGLPEEAALAAMVVHRLVTFYVPPIWGFFALRWLTRHGHV